jgi:hypothetical protein
MWLPCGAYKMRYYLTALGLAILIAVPTSAVADDTGSPFSTNPGAILCPNYFAIKEAKAAVAAGDKSWLDKTGCLQAQGRLRVVLIDAPLIGGSPKSDLPWRGRVYPPDNEADGATVYFDPWEVSTYAFATIPLVVSFPSTVPGFDVPTIRDVRSGDKPVAFKTAADAEHWYAQSIPDHDKPYVPHELIPVQPVMGLCTAVNRWPAGNCIDRPAGFQLRLGPTAYGLLSVICDRGKPSCYLLGRLPR